MSHMHWIHDSPSPSIRMFLRQIITNLTQINCTWHTLSGSNDSTCTCIIAFITHMITINDEVLIVVILDLNILIIVHWLLLLKLLHAIYRWRY